MQDWINDKLTTLKFWADEKLAEQEEGQGTVEYAVVLGVLVVAIVLAFNTANVGGTVQTLVGRISSLIPAAPTT